MGKYDNFIEKNEMNESLLLFAGLGLGFAVYKILVSVFKKMTKNMGKDMNLSKDELYNIVSTGIQKMKEELGDKDTINLVQLENQLKTDIMSDKIKTPRDLMYWIGYYKVKFGKTDEQ